MTPHHLREYLETLIHNSLYLSTMIWGAPGIGKSSIVRQIATHNDLGFIDLRLSQLAPTDLRGLPVPSDGITRWAVPEFLPASGRGILFMDEINMAPPAMQGVAQQLILDRCIGSYQLPEGWFVWAAGNRKEDRASVYDMPSPLANRFIHLTVEPNIENFRQYAFTRGLHEAIVGFIAFRNDLLHKMIPGEPSWPSPRSWEMASQLHGAGLRIDPAVGTAASAEFYAYLDVVGQIPDLDRILAGTQTPEFPAETSLKYACVMGLVARIKTVDQALCGLNWLVATATAEWTQLFVADLFPQLRDKGIFVEVQQRIMADSNLREFLTSYAKLLAG